VGTALAFGGVTPLAYSVMEIAVFGLVLAYVMDQIRLGKIDLPVPIWVFPCALFVLFQVVPLPEGFVRVLSPARIGFSAVALPGYIGVGWLPISVNTHDTLVGFTKLLAYLGAFVLSTTVYSSRRKSNLVLALVILGCFEAAYGIVQYLLHYQKIFWYTKEAYTTEATGTYINHNHFAGALEMIIPFALAKVFYTLEAQRSGGPLANRSRQKGNGVEAPVYALAAILMGVAIIFSRSRMGILALLTSFILLGLIGQLRSSSKRWTVVIVAIMVSLVTYGLWIGLGPVLERFEMLGNKLYFQQEGRVAIMRDGLRLLRDHVWVGTGLGTFGVAFHRYQTFLLDFSVEHAHNDYLEFATDMGLVGSGLLWVPVLVLWGLMLRAFFREPSRHSRSILLGCMGSTFAIFVHSVADFNLQIPANALLFAVILGIGYRVARLETQGSERKAPKEVLRTRVARTKVA
jgi:O-antigen ligase